MILNRFKSKTILQKPEFYLIIFVKTAESLIYTADAIPRKSMYFLRSDIQDLSTLAFP